LAASTTPPSVSPTDRFFSRFFAERDAQRKDVSRQLGGTVYGGGGGGSGSIWSPAVTESGGGFPGDHQRLAWTTTASQQQCYQNYSSYYTNMDYLSPAPHQLNVVVGKR